jgi:hypothetical protein
LEIGTPYQILEVVDNIVSATELLFYPIYHEGEIKGIITVGSTGSEEYLLQYGPDEHISANFSPDKDFVFVTANQNLFSYFSDNSVEFVADWSYLYPSSSPRDEYPRLDFNDIRDFAFRNGIVDKIYFNESLVENAE